MVEIEQHIVAEAFEIKLLRRVNHRVGAHVVGQLNLVEAAHFLRPEAGTPCFVERIDSAVLVLAPGNKGLRCVFRVVVAVIPPILIAHMPRRDRWIIAVTQC